MIGGVAIAGGSSDFSGSKTYNNKAANQVNDLFANKNANIESAELILILTNLLKCDIMSNIISFWDMCTYILLRKERFFRGLAS